MRYFILGNQNGNSRELQKRTIIKYKGKPSFFEVLFELIKDKQKENVAEEHFVMLIHWTYILLFLILMV